MTISSDIEKAEKPKEDAVVVYGKSRLEQSRPPMASDGSSISPSTRTTKSGNFSVQVPIDPSVLMLVSGTDDDSDYEEEKPDLFCGSCCDLLRACIIVDIIYILQRIQIGITVVLGLSVVTEEDMNQVSYDDRYDDDIVDELNQANSLPVLLMDFLVPILVTKNAVGILFGLICIYGASRFNQYVVLTTAIWMCIDVIWGIAFERYLSSLCTAFYTYPHFALFLALRKGKITRENYPALKYCCCGKGNKSRE